MRIAQMLGKAIGAHCCLIGTILALASVLLATSIPASQKSNQLEVELKAAMNKELVEGDLQGAIEQYRSIVARAGANRAVAAKALLQMGKCHEKLGDAEARKAYEQLVREYSDQREAAAEARSRLAELEEAKAGIARTGMVVRKVWPLEETRVGINDGSISPDGRSVVATDWATGNVAILELTSGKVRHLTNTGSCNLPSIGYGTGCIWSPDGKQVAYAWVSSSQGPANLSVDLRIASLDGSESRIVKPKQSAPYIQPYAWSPDGKTFLAALMIKDKGYMAFHIALVTVSDGSVQVLKSVKGINRGFMNISPDGRYVAYTHQQSDSAMGDISIFSIEQKRDLPLVVHPAHDTLLGWTPDGRQILFASNRTGSCDAWIIRVDKGVAAGEPELIKQGIGNVSTPNIVNFVPIGFTPVGSFYYSIEVSLEDIYTTEIDVQNGRLKLPAKKMGLPVEGGNSNPRFSPNGKHLAYMRVSQDGKTSLCLRDLEKGGERLIPSALRFLRPQWSSDGKEIFVKGQDWQGRLGIYRVSTQTLDVTPIVEAERDELEGGVIISPDGKVLFLRRWESMSINRILVRDLEKTTDKELFRQGGTQPLDIALSPDGRWLAFADRENDRHLKIIPATGGEPRTLCTWSQTGGQSSDPVWTPDGRNILFLKNRNRELWSISIDGGEPQNLGESDSRIGAPDIHPGGHQIAFSSVSSGGSSGIWVMENFLPKGDPEKKQREQ